MHSNGGRRTSSQPHQFQEASQPQHSRTNKLYFQAPSCVSPPKTPSVILFVTFSLFWARAAGSGELGVGDCYQAAGMPDRGFQAPLNPSLAYNRGRLRSALTVTDSQSPIW